MPFSKKNDQRKERVARFVRNYRANNSDVIDGSIFIDSETGVNYLLVVNQAIGGIAVTPLLDSNGKPIITSDD